MSVNVTPNSPSQDYVLSPDEHTSLTYEEEIFAFAHRLATTLACGAGKVESRHVLFQKNLWRVFWFEPPSPLEIPV